MSDEAMYKPSIEESLERTLRKLYKKDRKTYEAIIKKIQEILKNPQHYKPLRYSMKGLRRVHVQRSFVLIFEIIEQDKIVKFMGLSTTIKRIDDFFVAAFSSTQQPACLHCDWVLSRFDSILAPTEEFK